MLFRASTLMLAYAATSVIAGDLYMAFFNDDQCTAGEGTHVDTKNDGCLKEYGRQSFGKAGGSAGLYYPILIGYTDDNCQNEIGCQALPSDSDTDGWCQNFDPQNWSWGKQAQSFKFESGSPSVCPNGCSGTCPGGTAKRSLFETDLKSAVLRNKTAPAVLETRQAKDNDYAFCSNDDCTDCGTSIQPNDGGCSIEGSRKSVYSNRGGGSILLAGYNSAKQDCTGDQTAQVELKGKGCFPLTSGADGGPTSYAVIGVQ